MLHWKTSHTQHRILLKAAVEEEHQGNLVNPWDCYTNPRLFTQS